MGPSLASSVSDPVSDPILTIYDSNGVAIGGNDDWQEDINMVDIAKAGLAPANTAESATILHPPAGGYSAIVTSASAQSGIGLVEIYDLD